MMKITTGKNWLYCFVLIILITRVLSVHVHGHIEFDGHEHDAHHGGHVSTLITEGLQHADHDQGEFNIEIDHQGIVKNLVNTLDIKMFAIVFLIFGLWHVSSKQEKFRLRYFSFDKLFSPPYLKYLQLRAPPYSNL